MRGKNLSRSAPAFVDNKKTPNAPGEKLAQYISHQRMTTIVKKILLQRSQSVLFENTLAILDEQYTIITASDDKLGEALLKNQRDITAIVIFELTEHSLKVSELARNERFCDPTIPIAYVGNESATFPLPFGCTRFDKDSLDTLSEFLSIQLNIRALIVEDDDSLRDITAITLGKNMEVEAASNGDDAYQMIQNTVYDVIILDVMLPGKSGEEIFSHLRNKSKQTAVVIITAFDTDEREFHFSLEGAAGYIKKPFESNIIFRQQVMESIVSHHNKLETANLLVLKNEREIASDKHRRTMSKYQT